MVITDQQKNQHLLWRTGFGPQTEDIIPLATVSQKSLYKTILQASEASPLPINVADNLFKEMQTGAGDNNVLMRKKDLSQEEKKQFRKQSTQGIKSLNLTWLNLMVNDGAQLREKLALFWHGHFVSRNSNIFYQQLLLQVIRENALGNFGDLLHRVSRSAAMINFLNNNQNKKDHPNENFAREVMELFTMGRGNYTEHDVKEAARSFTGWGANPEGEFVFRKFQHDNQDKTVLGKTGDFDGDDVLNILLEQKQTARFIAGKIYCYFVNDKVDEQRTEWLADRFYHNNYDIKLLMEDIFTSHWFYEAKNIGARIKSPVELIAGIRRMLPMQIENEESQLLIQRVLGQLLFYPPNVAGWPGGTNWIDSSALMFRLRIPELIYAADAFQIKPKDDDDQMMGMKEMDSGEMRIKGFGKLKDSQVINAQINWEKYLMKFNSIPKEGLVSAIAGTVLQTPSGITDNLLKKYSDVSSRESFIKSTTIRLMSTPEYQLC